MTQLLLIHRHHAVADAAKRAKIEGEPLTRSIEDAPSLFERMLINASRTGIAAMLREQGLLSPLSALQAPATTELARIQRLMQTRHAGLPIAVQAHCECGVAK